MDGATAETIDASATAAGFDEIFDFVVVGSGGGSMCAALVLRAVGKSVLILEKTDLIGGTTARSGGVMWIPNNPFMKRAGVEDSAEQASAYLDNLIGDSTDAPGASRERRLTYVAEAPSMVEFLLQQGIKLTRVGVWPDYYDEVPGGSQAGRTVVSKLFDINTLGPWATLRATVERFNGFVGRGRDEDYHRGERAYDRWLGDPYNQPSETLGRIETGPFYAVPVVPGDVGTYGGVVTDSQARVLREDGGVIEGLYATGVSTASVMGRVYPGAGSSVGPSFVWGFIAAKHAANPSNTPIPASKASTRPE